MALQNLGARHYDSSVLHLSCLQNSYNVDDTVKFRGQLKIAGIPGLQLYCPLCAHPRETLSQAVAFEKPPTTVSVHTPLSNKLVFSQGAPSWGRISPLRLFCCPRVDHVVSLQLSNILTSLTFTGLPNLPYEQTGSTLSQSFPHQLHIFRSFLQRVLLFLTMGLYCSLFSKFTKHISPLLLYSASLKFSGHGIMRQILHRNVTGGTWSPGPDDICVSF